MFKKTIMKKVNKLWLIFLIGLFIRFFLMASAFHNDLDFLWRRPIDSSLNLYSTNTFYPPLGYFTFIALQPIYHLSSIIEFFPLQLFILKLPHLFVDLGIILVFKKVFDSKDQITAISYWWLNPIVIFATYGMGTLDIFPAFFVALAMLAGKPKGYTSTIYLSLASAYKTIPIFLLPPAILYLGKNFILRFKLLILNVVLILVISFLFKIIAKADVMNSFIPKGIAPTSFSCTFRPDSLWACSKFFIGSLTYVTLLLLLFINPKSFKSTPYQNILFAAFTFAFISFPANSIHRYLPLFVLLTFFWVRQKNSKLLFLILITCLFLGYIYTWNLQWGLFSSVYPQVKNLPALREWVLPLVNYENIAFILRVMADLILFYLAMLGLKKVSFKKIHAKFI